MNQEDIKKFQNKSVKKMVNYAYHVPVYREKYKKAGIKPDDINTINNIDKLPFISKEELLKKFPDEVTPSFFNKNKAFVATTSGTTGRSLPIYFDVYAILTTMIGFVRALNEHQINWYKTRITLLIDLTENSFENEYFLNSVFSFIKPFFSLRNFQILDVLDDPEKVAKKIEEFSPEVIIGYPFMLIPLASLKKKGFLENIHLRIIGSSGAFFDQYSKSFVEKMFNTKIFDTYAATESGIIASECSKGNYHVYSDLVYLEYLKNGTPVSSREPGSIVVTKLYGRGTPIVRYTGLQDVVTFSKKECDCGFSGGLIKEIHGRKSDSILLPEGKMVFISVFENAIGKILQSLGNVYVKRIQIIQHILDKFEIDIQFDDEIKYKTNVKEKMFFTFKNILREKLGSNIEIIINEVEDLDSKAPYLISTVDKSNFLEKIYIT
jgi:phenylacetate-CoA ligase